MAVRYTIARAQAVVCTVLQVAARVQTAVNMNGLTKSMKGVVKGMSRVLDNMNPETVSVLTHARHVIL